MKNLKKLAVMFSVATGALLTGCEDTSPTSQDIQTNDRSNIEVNREAGVVTQKIDRSYTVMIDYKDSIYVKSVGYDFGDINHNKEIQIPFKDIKDPGEKAKIKELAQFLKMAPAPKK